MHPRHLSILTALLLLSLPVAATHGENYDPSPEEEAEDGHSPDFIERLIGHRHPLRYPRVYGSWPHPESFGGGGFGGIGGGGPGQRVECKTGTDYPCVALLLHGINEYSVTGGYDNVKSHLLANGFDVVNKLAYYGLECGADGVGFMSGAGGISDGSSHSHWFGGPGEHVDKWDECPGEPTWTIEHHDYDTDIRHIANHVAWYIYHSYTAPPSGPSIPIQVWAYSMGGLIIRYALAHVGEDQWPPTLKVANVATHGTPHLGSSVSCLGTNDQMEQMCTTSSFIDWLYDFAQDPQGTGGTDWTLIGSECDAVVTADEATGMEAGHAVYYRDIEGTWSEPEWCPSHTGGGPGGGPAAYHWHTGSGLDAHVTYYDAAGGPFWFDWSEAPYAVPWSNKALQKSAW